MPEESQVESCEHQDNANIHYQPLPEPVSQEQEIHTHYNGYHRHHVKHDSYLSAHFSETSILAWNRQAPHKRASYIGFPLGQWRPPHRLRDALCRDWHQTDALGSAIIPAEIGGQLKCRHKGAPRRVRSGHVRRRGRKSVFADLHRPRARRCPGPDG